MEARESVHRYSFLWRRIDKSVQKIKNFFLRVIWTSTTYSSLQLEQFLHFFVSLFFLCYNSLQFLIRLLDLNLSLFKF